MSKFDKNGLADKDAEVTIYHFGEKGELIGSSLYYCPAGTGIPAGSTRAIPLPVLDNQTNVLVDGKWKLTDDFRGQHMFSIKTGEMYTIHEFGPIPDGFTLSQPSSLYDEYINGKWVKNLDKERRHIVQQNQNIRKELLLDANLIIDGTQDFIDSGLAPAGMIAMHKAWRNYRARLFLVSLPNPEWPTLPSQDIEDYPDVPEAEGSSEVDGGDGSTEDSQVETQADNEVAL